MIKRLLTTAILHSEKMIFERSEQKYSIDVVVNK